MRRAVRDQRQTALLEKARLLAFKFQPAGSRCDHHEDHHPIKFWNVNCPGGGQLSPAIERAGQPQHVQRFGKRVGHFGNVWIWCGHERTLEENLRIVHEFGRSAYKSREYEIDNPEMKE
jgi:hypothetical protein